MQKALDGLRPRLIDFPGSDFLVSVAQMKPDGSAQFVILPGGRRFSLEWNGHVLLFLVPKSFRARSLSALMDTS